MNATAPNDDLGTASRPSADEADIDALMRGLLQHMSGAPDPVEEAATAHPAAPRRDFDTAAELLDRASQAFGLLISRCENLEHALDEAHDRDRTRELERKEAIEQWRLLASGLKAQVEASEPPFAALKARCDAAEARAAVAERRASALERASAQAAAHAATADQLSTKLHDRVVAAFGIGSRAHSVLETVVTGAAAK